MTYFYPVFRSSYPLWRFFTNLKLDSSTLQKAAEDLSRSDSSLSSKNSFEVSLSVSSITMVEAPSLGTIDSNPQMITENWELTWRDISSFLKVMLTEWKAGTD
jgi:hypothetical protein